MRAYQRRQEALLLQRKTGDVGILEDVGAVHVVLAVRDCQAEFVQARGAAEHRAIIVVERPVRSDLVEHAQRRELDPLRLSGVDAVTLHQRGDRGFAWIVDAAAAEHVVKRAFAQRGLAHRHTLQAERKERGLEHE